MKHNLTVFKTIRLILYQTVSTFDLKIIRKIENIVIFCLGNDCLGNRKEKNNSCQRLQHGGVRRCSRIRTDRLTHLCPPLRSTFAVRETASLLHILKKLKIAELSKAYINPLQNIAHLLRQQFFCPFFKIC